MKTVFPFLVLLTIVPLSAQTGETVLVIRKSTYSLEVLRNDSLVASFAVAVGKNAGDKQRVGDNRTPEGEFVISRIHDSRHWVHDFGDGKGPVDGAYGPWFLRLDTGAHRTNSGKAWKGIGIHGTHDPASVGTMASEGCVRLRNEDLEELRKLVRPGTSVRIVP